MHSVSALSGSLEFNGYIEACVWPDDPTPAWGEPLVHPMVLLFRETFPTASHPYYAYKYDPLHLLSYLCHSKDLQQLRREGDCVLNHLGFSSSCLRSSFLVTRVSRCIHDLVECSGQVNVCELVTLGVWRLLDGLGALGFLGELLEIVGASRKLGAHGSRPTVLRCRMGTLSEHLSLGDLSRSNTLSECSNVDYGEASTSRYHGKKSSCLLCHYLSTFLHLF
jgi:hypothetical protein